jgi:signal transduction histidine kinase
VTSHLDELWLATLQEVVQKAAHEVKDALNGVSLNLEVIRSRSARVDSDYSSLSAFAMAASEQLEALSARTEALLFLSRPQRPGNGPVDVAITLRHLGALLVPAAKSDGGFLSVEGTETSAPTAASTVATRLALAAGLLALTKEVGSRGGASGDEGRRAQCRLESGDERIVVRFSHESAGTCSLEPAVASAIAEHGIENGGSGSDLLLVFPGHS